MQASSGSELRSKRRGWHKNMLPHKSDILVNVPPVWGPTAALMTPASSTVTVSPVIYDGLARFSGDKPIMRTEGNRNRSRLCLDKKATRELRCAKHLVLQA